MMPELVSAALMVVWMGLFWRAELDRNRMVKVCREALAITKSAQAERDHLRSMLWPIAGIRFVSEDGAKIIQFSVSRPDSIYIQTNERMH